MFSNVWACVMFLWVVKCVVGDVCDWQRSIIKVMKVLDQMIVVCHPLKINPPIWRCSYVRWRASNKISFIWRCYYCREELQIWAFARRLTKDFEQGGIFIVPHPLRHLISYFIYYFAFSSQGPPPFTTNMVLKTQILTGQSKRRVIWI